MPRKQFKADLEDAIQGKHGVQHISDCRPGEEDGQLTFVFTHSTLVLPATITAEVSEQSDYPTAHGYTLWVDDAVPRHVASKMGRLIVPQGKSIKALLTLVSDSLSASSHLPDPASADSDDEPLQDQDSNDHHDSDDDYGDEDAYDGAFDEPISSTSAAFTMPATTRANPSSLYQSRIRRDLIYARDAGFKISRFGGLFDNYKCVISMSIPARRLGISEEAMQAWRIEPSDFIILLIQYKEGYKTNEEVGVLNNSAVSKYLEIRLGASKNYKPTEHQVTNAFSTNAKPVTQDNADPTLFRDTFVSKPLNNLMNDRLVSLIRLRDAGMSWQGAEDFYRDSQGMSFDKTISKAEHFEPEPASGYPAVVDADHMADKSVKSRSFPLIAMQFMLRHFVRCTEFCLVCHKKLDSLVEAIKPYVCDNPLCLYQYMSLGFGPSIEHEIMVQDKVVDLLISFCYSSANLGRLKDFPVGLGICVPRTIISEVAAQIGRGMYGSSVQPAAAPSPVEGRLEARFDMTKSEILFDNVKPGTPCPLKKGDWIALELPDQAGSPLYHCRVAEVSLFPSIETGPLIGPATSKELSTTAKWCNAFVDKYTVKFDDLSDAQKRGVMYHLLALLPSVKEMNAYLAKQSTPDLARWVDRISPAAFAVLRWTLASNRSCIMAVDESEKAVYGMPDYMQFRFAMGAPDKEHRFKTAVKDSTARLGSKYPTLYAWHGSSIQNWHSIIREGLHYSEIINGRAFGNGVYHAPNVATSMGYSGMAAHGYGNTSVPHVWPNSDLQISSAIALNEIVNAPNEFVSSNPHYVVSQLDWIQTRYLFVKCTYADVDADKPMPVFDKVPTRKLEQDPSRVPIGAANTAIVIPDLSSKSGKRKLANIRSPGPKKTKKVKNQNWFMSKITPAREVVDLTGDSDVDMDESRFEDSGLSDNSSVVTDDEDREIFEEPQSHQLAVRTGPPPTDFVPGSLDHDKLPKLPMPSYANSTATRRLSQDLNVLLAVQKHTPLHELGWYIDPEKIDNIYQWIVELHSFNMFNQGDIVLPLVTDMKKYKVKSIVLELRFPGSYPNNPPFIRVIRPRFLPFANGGGGHVTAGGAICHALLTSDGWLPTNTIESVLLQIRMAMASTEPAPARLQLRGTYAEGDQNSYGSGEAVEAYRRACQMHGWTIPADFNQTIAEQ